MPFCEVGGDGGASNGFKIFYRTYGHGPTKVLLIIGLAGTHDSWGPQIKGLTGTETPNDDDFTAVDRRPEYAGFAHKAGLKFKPNGSKKSQHSVTSGSFPF